MPLDINFVEPFLVLSGICANNKIHSFHSEKKRQIKIDTRKIGAKSNGLARGQDLMYFFCTKYTFFDPDPAEIAIRDSYRFGPWQVFSEKY